MNRRPAADRHALLTAQTYSTTSSAATGGRSWDASPLESPYAPRAGDRMGAPKKEPQGDGYVSLFGSLGAQQQRTASDLEEQNDSRLEGLSERIKMLKDISTGIGEEVRESTADLNSLSDLFSNGSALLGNTFSRMNRMARRQRGWFCNMMLFLLFVIWIFVFLWWWRR